MEMFCYCAEGRRVARLLTARYDAALAEAGLTSAQFELLQVIAATAGLHGRALAERLSVDPATLSRNLKTLVAAGLVRARREQIDARRAGYSLTAGGRRRLAQAEPLWQRVHRSTRADLAEQADALRSALLLAASTLRV